MVMVSWSQADVKQGIKCGLLTHPDDMQVVSMTSVPTSSLESDVPLRGALVSSCWRS